MAETGTDVQRAAQLLREGKLVAIPTETVYGLAANALNENAVLSIFEAKQRPFFDPLIVHVHSTDAVNTYATLNDPRLEDLAAACWPGPLTLLLPKNDIIPDLVTSGLPRVGIRVPDHPLTLRLLETSGLPLAAPSANPFGYISPTQPTHVEKQLGNKVSYILDGGPSHVGLESTIVGIENDGLCVYRLGGLSTETILRVAGKFRMALNVSSDPSAPGQLTHHYAPAKRLILGRLEDLAEKFRGKKLALIGMQIQAGDYHDALLLDLSPSGDLREAAVNLFHFLREADESQAELVLAQEVPEKGLGMAINDRLRRAAAR